MAFTGKVGTRVAPNDYLPALKQRLRQPRLAEMVADGLRERILSGELADGAMLPKQDDLLLEFRVSPPSIREALRILETEGLITVQRGNIGGAVVHRPQPGKTAYMLAMVLQSRSVNLQDVQNAIRHLEPACVAACATRPDRETTILPRLRDNIDQSRTYIDDADKYIGLARQFHVEIVTGCGNETMSLIIGALESLWSAQIDRLARRPAQHGAFADRSVRLETLKDHEKLYRYIAKGDAAGAERAAREHYSDAAQDSEGWQHAFDLNAIINASTLRDG
jgi:GntR family transcriptional repressor for pyruvate dehydrogenase complex